MQFWEFDLKAMAELAQIWRADVQEGAHFGAAAVVNEGGDVIAGWGDIDTITYPRSSMKPFQALALIETGAANAYGLSAKHLAIACGSHRGETMHTQLVTQWLSDLGCSSDALACGPHYPGHIETYHHMIANHEVPTPIHNNCSGKHSGFLTVCRHCGFDIESYSQTDHPTQQLFAANLDELGAKKLAWGIDGCTLPTPALPIVDTARLAASFSACSGTSKRSEAMQALLDAMRKHPEFTSGSDHPMGKVIDATQGKVIFKIGAEGFLLAFVPAQRLGIAIKVTDGSDRARVPALIAILHGLKLIDSDTTRGLSSLMNPPITDTRNKVVGSIKPSPELLMLAQ